MDFLSGISHASGIVDDWCGTKPPGPPIPHGASTLLERIGLNPQPLPPKEAAGGLLQSLINGFDVDDWCGTVPKHFPPPPPPPGPLGEVLGGMLGAR